MSIEQCIHTKPDRLGPSQQDFTSTTSIVSGIVRRMANAEKASYVRKFMVAEVGPRGAGNLTRIDPAQHSGGFKPIPQVRSRQRHCIKVSVARDYLPSKQRVDSRPDFRPCGSMLTSCCPMPCSRTCAGRNSLLGLTSEAQDSTSFEEQKDATATWQMLDGSSFAVSTSTTTKSIYDP